MSVLDCLESVARAVHPQCAKCLYRLGLVKFVTSPCPACRLDGYRMYDILMRRQSAAHFVPLGRNLWGGRRDLTSRSCSATAVSRTQIYNFKEGWIYQSFLKEKLYQLTYLSLCRGVTLLYRESL